MKVYERTENGVTTQIPLKEGLDIINYAMMDGKRFVETMSASRTDAQIEYKNGEKITLRQVEVEVEVEAEEPEEWTGTRTRFNYLHRFDLETLRARCNRRFAPISYYPGVHEFKTRSDIENREHADLYTFCPKCEEI